MLSFLGAVVAETALRSWQDPLGLGVCCGNPLLCEYGTYKAVKARLGPWRSGKNLENLLRCSLFVRKRSWCVAASLGTDVASRLRIERGEREERRGERDSDSRHARRSSRGRVPQPPTVDAEPRRGHQDRCVSHNESQQAAELFWESARAGKTGGLWGAPFEAGAVREEVPVKLHVPRKPSLYSLRSQFAPVKLT